MKTIAYIALVSPLVVLAAIMFFIAWTAGCINEEIMNAERVLRAFFWPTAKPYDERDKI
jgi:hypothetical protein